MALIQTLHMNGGAGDTSYAQNSSVQRHIISSEHPNIREAISDTLCNKNVSFPASFGIADLGCSSGPNTLTLISEVIEMVSSASAEMGFPVPELRVYLNDLPGNDFNAVFRSLPGFYEKQRDGFSDTCFVSCVAGSFYGRLFPKRSLHFVHSSSSLHWLSQVPPQLDGNMGANKAMNKGKIYISKSSPRCVWDAYLKQFEEGFGLFLKSRSEEIVPGGRMVLSFLGRKTSDPTTEDSCYQWELLALALNTLLSKGRITEEKLDTFNAPYYAPSIEEVKNMIERDGSFLLNSLETSQVKWDAASDTEVLLPLTGTVGSRVARTIRAVVESMLEAQFGGEIMDELFLEFAELVDDYSLRLEPNYTNLVVSVTRK